MPLWAHLRIKEGPYEACLEIFLTTWLSGKNTTVLEAIRNNTSKLDQMVGYIRRKSGAEGPRVGVRAALRAACLKHGQKSLSVRLHGAVSLCFGDAKLPPRQRQATNQPTGFRGKLLCKASLTSPNAMAE